eukprot:tig00000215_g18569.t1
MAFTDFVYVITYVLYQVYLFWKVCRIRAIVAFENWLNVKPVDALRHKIVIIGDGLAMGHGDTLSFGEPVGVARYLKAMIQADSRIKQRFQVVNKGRVGTTSKDWLPNRAERPRLLEETLDSKHCRDAEVVLVMLGAEDSCKDYAEADQTVENIKAVARAVRARGFECFVAVPPVGKEPTDALKARAQRVAEYCCKNDDGAMLGADLSGHKFTNYANVWSWIRPMFFSRQGYVKASDQWADVIVNTLVAVQWKTWKRMVGPRPHEEPPREPEDEEDDLDSLLPPGDRKKAS